MWIIRILFYSDFPLWNLAAMQRDSTQKYDPKQKNQMIYGGAEYLNFFFLALYDVTSLCGGRAGAGGSLVIYTM